MNDVGPDNLKIYSGGKSRIPEIRSLAMLKMEKNLIAVIDKNYSRQPYKASANHLDYLIHRLIEETAEPEEACLRSDLINMGEELADVSNLCDYIFERVQILRAKLEEGELLRRVDELLMEKGGRK
jgi:hypothetical protein